MVLASAAQAPLSARLTLGVIPTVAPYLLPALTPGLAAAHPGLTLYLREEKTAELVTRLVDGRLDLALLALPLPAQVAASSARRLTTEGLFDDPFYIACPAGHRLAALSRVAAVDLADETLLLLNETHCLSGQALTACRRAPSDARVTFEATSLTTLAHMVAGGIGVTLLPGLALAGRVTAGADLRIVPLAPPESRRIGLAWRRDDARAGDFRRLGAVIAETATRLMVGGLVG